MKAKMNLLSLFFLAFTASLQAIQSPPVATSDDFNDNYKDTAKWGNDLLVDTGTNAVLTEINGRLEITGSDAAIIRPWIASTGSYVQNWEVSADLHLGSLTPSNGSGTQIFLVVVNAEDATMGDRIVVALDLYRDNDILFRGYELSSAVNDLEASDAPGYVYLSSADEQARLRIAFDASTKKLAASYNGIPLGLVDVEASGSDWQMSGSAGFSFALGGSMWGSSFTNSGHEVYADNFEVRTGNTLTYGLIVDNGTGGGSYTNKAVVTVSAFPAPTGQVFDHWIGSTQYLASVTAAVTTVTMPAEFISLAPAYTLSETGTGDDFNDNSKDLLKWGDDNGFSGTAASLQETNARLEFLKQTGGDGQGALRPWIADVGSYTQNWEVAVDASLSPLALVQDGSWVEMSLAVGNRGETDLTRDMLSIGLLLNRSDGRIYRDYKMTARVNGIDLTGAPSYGTVSTADLQGRLKIAFDAATKVLTASYNGAALGWIDVDALGSDWDMTENSTFGFGLTGSCWIGTLGIASGEASFDNFSVKGAIAPPADGDGNGLPDWWEQFYFSATGVDPNVLCANGVNTRIEAYVAGIDPNNPDAFFGITGGDTEKGVLWWNAVSGRVYAIYWSTNLLTGFLPMQTNYTGGAFTDAVHGAEGKCFYKLDVRLGE